MSPNRPALFLTTPPQYLKSACVYGLPIGHMAYCIGAGGHLLRSSIPIGMRGGLMVIGDESCDGRGTADTFCSEVMQECAARKFDGIICDFEKKPSSLSGSIIEKLGELSSRRNWPFFIPEHYAPFSAKARIMISSALSGGSLKQRLNEAAAKYGAEKLVLAVQRSAEDFFLPSPSGGGTPLSREELQKRIQDRAPSIFFSDELCAHYFTYMSRQSGAHFVLFDDAGSIRKKLFLAKEAGIRQAVLAYPEVDDLLPALLA